MRVREHLAQAREHVRQAAEARGVELDVVMRELCTAFTALTAADKELEKEETKRRAAP